MEVSAVGRFVEGSGILRCPVLYLQPAFGTESQKKTLSTSIEILRAQKRGSWGYMASHCIDDIWESGYGWTMSPSTNMIFGIWNITSLAESGRTLIDGISYLFV